MRVAVIGAGPAGLSAAYALTKVMPAVDVYEAGDSVGGLARSMRLWGQTVDIGPHRFFSRDRRVNELWLEIVGRDYRMVQRLTRIFYKGRFLHYPLQPLDAFSKLGLKEAMRCAISYLGSRAAPQRPDDSFESWMSARFGKRLYEIFFKAYSEKLWGLRCEELDADFAAQRIKQFSLATVIKQIVFSNENRKHATLCDQFAYPIEGTGMVYCRMARAVSDRGGRVLLRTPVQRLVTREGRCVGIELMDGTFKSYDQVVSSMPLTILVQRLAEAPPAIKQLASKLTYRNTIIVYVELANEDVCPDQWIYVQDPNILSGRITNFSNWAPEIRGDSARTILAMEYWCNANDELWRQHDEHIIALATRELLATKLVPGEVDITNALVCRVPRCYPVYRRGYRELLGPVKDYLKSIDGLHVIGRYGAFKYNNQDHSILMGLLAANNILQQQQNDLWDVNSDYNCYQEACRITESGLVAAE
jgi:protoporphyrinogen oxidase